jgi:hypothetical protein
MKRIEVTRYPGGYRPIEISCVGDFGPTQLIDVSPTEARKLAAELVLAAKKCEERISNETD